MSNKQKNDNAPADAAAPATEAQTHAAKPSFIIEISLHHDDDTDPAGRVLH